MAEAAAACLRAVLPACALLCAFTAGLAAPWAALGLLVSADLECACFCAAARHSTGVSKNALNHAIRNGSALNHGPWIAGAQ